MNFFGCQLDQFSFQFVESFVDGETFLFQIFQVMVVAVGRRGDMGRIHGGIAETGTTLRRVHDHGSVTAQVPIDSRSECSKGMRRSGVAGARWLDVVQGWGGFY